MSDLITLIIEGNSSSPSVDFNPVTGNLILSGRSIPENAIIIYEPLAEWVVKYVKQILPLTNLRLNLEYFNTASSIWIARIVKTLCSARREDALLILHLYFGIEEFEAMEQDDIEEVLSPFTGMIAESRISVGIKIYGTGSDGEVIKENMILL